MAIAFGLILVAVGYLLAWFLVWVDTFVDFVFGAFVGVFLLFVAWLFMSLDWFIIVLVG